MKKLLLGLVLSFALILGACGNDEAEKKDDNKKSESVEKKKEAPKKEAKETEESKEVTENVSTEEPTAQEPVEQPVTQEEPAPVEQQQTPVQEQQTEQPLQGDLPADLNESEEQNTNMNGEHVVAPGYKNQEEQSQAYEEYKKGKEAQAQAGPSAVPGAGMMDLSDFE